jgi:acetyl esterase/lipase
VEELDGITEENRSGDFHCLAICHRENPKQAVLCVYGGGLLLAPPRMFVGFAKKMAANTGADVWFPYYPLCDEYTIRDSVRMLYEVYAKMCREYEDVRWYGYSSGGALLLLLGAYLNDNRNPLPMPEKLVLISPGGVPATDEEWEKMQSLNGKDIMLSAQYMKTIQPLLSHGNKTVPRWMQSCDGADFSDFPETWIYYGTSEVLSAKAEAYDEMLTKAGVKHHLKMAKDMPHCYCATVFFPEARADYEETMRILRE